VKTALPAMTCGDKNTLKYSSISCAIVIKVVWGLTKVRLSYCPLKAALSGPDAGGCGENASHIGRCINQRLGGQAKRGAPVPCGNRIGTGRRKRSGGK
jgi:hypothetical protein